ACASIQAETSESLKVAVMTHCSATSEHRADRPAAGAAAWVTLVAAAVALGLCLAGCSQANSTRLPELATLPRGLLSKDQQKEAVEELEDRRKVHRKQAIEEIKSAQRN